MGLVGRLVRLGGVLCLWLGFGCCLRSVDCLRVLLVGILALDLVFSVCVGLMYCVYLVFHICGCCL